MGRASVSRRGVAIFVAGQIACAMVLLVVAGLLTESIVRLGDAPLGFNPDGLLTMTIKLLRIKYATASARADVFDCLVAALDAVPGTLGAAVSTSLLRGLTQRLLLIDGRPDPSPDVTAPDINLDLITPDYFPRPRRAADRRPNVHGCRPPRQRRRLDRQRSARAKIFLRHRRDQPARPDPK